VLLKDLGEFYEMAMVGVFMKADIFLKVKLILVIFQNCKCLSKSCLQTLAGIFGKKRATREWLF